jgi:predicted ABC-type ATPase
MKLASQPTIYLIGGCNGAGKTTFAKEFLPKEVKCLRFLNADEIARGLSPLKPSAGAIRAARLLLTQVDECLPLATRWAIWDSRSIPAKRLAISGVHSIESVPHLIIQ